MVDVARVNLYGQSIGFVRWDQRYEIAQFEYDPDFVRQRIEPSPLMMPVREGRVSFVIRFPFKTGNFKKYFRAMSIHCPIDLAKTESLFSEKPDDFNVERLTCQLTIWLCKTDTGLESSLGIRSQNIVNHSLIHLIHNRKVFFDISYRDPHDRGMNQTFSHIFNTVFQIVMSQRGECVTSLVIVQARDAAISPQFLQS